MKKLIYVLWGSLLCLSCSSGSEGSDTQNEVPEPDPTPSDALTVTNARSYMVDPNATEETVALFYNLKKLSKTKTIVGHQDAFNFFYQDNRNMSDIKKTTGNDPGLLGSDFMFITDKNNPSNNWFVQQENKIIADTKEAYSKGMVNIFCWHLREPYNEESFYASDMTDQQKTTAFRGLLPNGAFHDWYKTKLDKVAQVLNNLTAPDGTKIPVIFRPFHEFDGNWFWWGQSYCTAEEYKAVFQFTVTYLRDVKNVHNVLYSFAPDNTYSNSASYLSRYPGDDYVDVLGMDNYGDLGNGQGTAGADRANAKLKMISDLAVNKVKIAAFTETGYLVNNSNAPIDGWFSNYAYTTISKNNPEIAFIMFWYNYQNSYYVPTPSNPNAADFLVFSNKAKCLLQNDLPDLYTLPQN